VVCHPPCTSTQGRDLVARCHRGRRRPFTGASAGPGWMDACCDDERSSLIPRLLWSRRGGVCQVTSPDTHVDPNKIACGPRSSVSSSLPPRSTQRRPGVATLAGLDSQRRYHHTRSSSRQPGMLRGKHIRQAHCSHKQLRLLITSAIKDAYTPIRCTPIRCTPVKCTPVRCTPVRCTPIRCTPINTRL
jgi:hypothetical protein